jgi:hypothetical protein
MTMNDVKYLVSLLLIPVVLSTGITGLIQVKLDLHHFIYHRYLAYGTLVLSGFHLIFNFGKLYRYLTRR